MSGYDWGYKSCLLFGAAVCPLFRSCLSIEVNGKAVVTSEIVCYIVDVYC